MSLWLIDLKDFGCHMADGLSEVHVAKQSYQLLQSQIEICGNLEPLNFQDCCSELSFNHFVLKTPIELYSSPSFP